MVPPFADRTARLRTAIAQLNDEQREAVLLPLDQSALVLADPGTGKTKVLTTRYAYLVHEGTNPDQLLAVTLGREAAAELKQRIYALTGITHPQIGTLHGTCRRMLQQCAPLVGLTPNFRTLEAPEARRVLQAAIAGGPRLKARHPEIAAVIDLWKRSGIGPRTAPEHFHLVPDHLADEAQDLVSIYARYRTALKGINAVDFSDLILLPLIALAHNEPFRRRQAARFRHILQDEVQDANRSQETILATLALGGAVRFDVGDDKQAIYGFAGSEITIIQGHRQSRNHVIQLKRNYRSTPEIIAVTNAIASALADRLSTDPSLPTRAAGGPVTSVRFSDDQDERAFIRQTIGSLLDAGYQPKNIAVIARVQAVLRGPEDTLSAAGIPVYVPNGSFWRRTEIADLLNYLRAILDPNDRDAFLAIVNKPSRFIPRAMIDSLATLEPASGFTFQEAVRLKTLTPARHEAQVHGLVDLMMRWRADAPAPAELIRRIVDQTKYLASLPPGRAEDSSMAIEELITAAGEHTSAADLLHHAQAAKPQRSGGDNAVQLLTAHGSKGKEYPIVLVIACEEQFWPHPHQADDNEAEERRLWYVAASRPKDILIFTHAIERAGKPSLPSPYLTALDTLRVIDATDLPDESDDETAA